MEAVRPDVSLVIPVYNEEECLPYLYDAVVEAMSDFDFEVVLVDDGSTDGSEGVLADLAERDARIRVVHFVRNSGQTAAIMAGIHHSRGPILVTLDADLQNDPADIPEMIEMLDDADVICGWRRDRKDTWLTRTLPSKLANAMISRISGVSLHDYGCTLRVYRREYLEQIPLYGEMHRFIPVYVTWAGARLREHPVQHHPRTFGTSKYGIFRTFKVLLDLSTVMFLRDYFTKPIYFFGKLGALFGALGVISGAAAVCLWAVAGWGRDSVLAASLAVLSPILVVVAVLQMSLGIIAEVLIRTHYEVQNQRAYQVRKMINIDIPEGS